MEEWTKKKNDITTASALPSHAIRSKGNTMLRIALITNHPPPFRIPIYHKVAATPGIDLRVIFCSPREPNRQWEVPPMHFDHVFLKEHFVTRGSNFIHNNPDVLTKLSEIAPDVIVTTGFNPTYLYAFAYAVLRGIPHVPMTDGTDVSEQGLSRWHKMIRRIVYARSRAFISASHGGRRLYEGYGIPPERCFQSCLCADNEAFLHMEAPANKRFDLIFCGRIVNDKNPLFTLEVAERAARRLRRRIRLLYVGTGEQEEQVRQEAARRADMVHAVFHGHAAQHELPRLYASARIFLFPTVHDAWGVVANEACAAGLPIVVSPHAGVVGELVVDGENGFVCPLDLEAWTDRVTLLLSDEALYQRFARRSSAIVSNYTFDHAASGIVDACRYAAGDCQPGKLGRASQEWG
jgi:glycosyltransferase involved in cell wall biosynthesis